MEIISDDSYNLLICGLDPLNILSSRFKMMCRSMSYETTYKKGARILNAGSKQRMIWFLLEGLVREIRVNKETFEENTIWFWFDMNFMYTTPGFFNRVASESTIEVLEDCRVGMISQDDWIQLKNSFEETELVAEQLRGEYDIIRWQHADDIKNLTTEERYLKNEKQLMDLFNRTQLRFIAEFMGMAPDTLGKLRRKYLRRS